MLHSDAMSLTARKSYKQQQRSRLGRSNMRQLTNVVFAFLCVLCCTASCLAVKFEHCDSELGTFTEVSVTGCGPEDQKCNLVRGTNASISITFIPNQDINQVNVVVYGILFNIPIPFPLKNPDVCKDSSDGVKCPLQKGQEYHYTTSLLVQKAYPKVSVGIQWELVNEKKEKIVCVKFPAKIK